MKNATLSLLVFGIIIFFSIQSSKAQSSLKGSGEVFYHQTFDWGNPDDEKGWTAPEGFYFEDLNDNGFNWHWYPNDSLIAQYTKEPPFRSSSPEDGHLCLFLNRYNNDVDPEELSSDYYLVNNAIVFPSFDCSDRSSVIVRFETSFMPSAKSNGMEMFISSDYGVHWAIFNLGFGTSHKERPNGVAPGEAAIFEANISEIAAGMPNVIIKIHWAGVINYFWLIDDFQLVEALDNDLRLLHYSLEWDDGDEYTKVSYMHNIPISQLGGAYTNFEAGVVNFGEFDQTDVYLDIDISKNYESIWHYATEPEWMPAAYTDTSTLTESFTPTEFGHYKISYELKQEEAEQTPEDNKGEIFFNVTDSIYSRCDNTSEEPFMYGIEAYGLEGEPNEQIFVGSIFPIYGDTEINSVSVYVVGGLADGMIEFRGSLLWLPPGSNVDDPLFEMLVSEIVTLDSSMFNTWVTLHFEKDGISEFLMAGEIFYAGVEYWNWHTENVIKKHQNFTIGSDRGVKLKDPVARIRRGPFDDFIWWGFGKSRNLMIRMNLNDHSNIIDGISLVSSMNQLGQNYPNPFDNSTDIDYELSIPSEVEIEITDITGRSVMKINEGNLPAGTHSTKINTENLESGIYFYTLKAGKFIDTKKMLISK